MAWAHGIFELLAIVVLVAFPSLATALSDVETGQGAKLPPWNHIDFLCRVRLCRQKELTLTLGRHDATRWLIVDAFPACRTAAIFVQRHSSYKLYG